MNNGVSADINHRIAIKLQSKNFSLDLKSHLNKFRLKFKFDVDLLDNFSAITET